MARATRCTESLANKGGFEEFLRALRAGNSDSERSHLRRGGQLKREEWTTLAFCDHELGDESQPFLIARKAKGISLARFLECSYTRLEPRQKRGFTFPLFRIGKRAYYR
jgi:hypothetical protein